MTFELSFRGAGRLVHGSLCYRLFPVTYAAAVLRNGARTMGFPLECHIL